MAVRIPKSLAAETGMTQDSSVEISLGKNGIEITRIVQPKYSLEELVAGVTRRNRHPEFDTGKPVGNEIW